MFSTSILLLVILILVIVALCSVLFLKRSNFTTRLNEQQRTAATVSNIFDIATSDNASNKNALDEKNSKVSVSKYEERAVENSFSNNNNDDDDDSAAIVDIIPSSTKKKMKRIEKFPKSFYKLTNNDRNNTDSQDDYEYENDDKNYTYNENDGNSSDSSFHIGDYIGTLLTSTQPNNLLFKFDLNNIIENWDMDFNDSSTSDGGG